MYYGGGAKSDERNLGSNQTRDASMKKHGRWLTCFPVSRGNMIISRRKQRLACTSGNRLIDFFQLDFSESVNTPANFEAPGSPRTRSFRLAAASLAVFLALLAIAVKTLHYTGHSAEIRYFSSSVKIVKAGPKEFGSTAPVRVAPIETPRVVAAAPLDDDFAQIYRPEIPPARTAFFARQPLRGPPSIV